MTGHLVLSTLHTNDAVGCVTRLRDMGLESHLIAATLRLSVAQRLVRALCPSCRIKREASYAESIALGLDTKLSHHIYDKCGCLACAGRGFKGRTGLFEMFRPDRDLSGLIASGGVENEIYEAARVKGMKILIDDAREKCLAGITSLTEVMRTLGGIL
jgi:type II secretory ATPase GspE/PulE/Tfp pilus assembly ATPase PilB-like protein